MGRFVRNARRALDILFGHHPPTEILLAFRDGELDILGHWTVEAHFRRCSLCRKEASLIEEDLRTFQKMDRVLRGEDWLNSSEALGRLCSAIQYWEASIPSAGTGEPVLGDSVLQQMEKEFDYYLGRGATMAFLRETWSGNRQNLLTEAQLALRDFLGPNAASSITRRIICAQMLTDNRLRSSLPT
jgi:hypothetical protein